MNGRSDSTTPRQKQQVTFYCSTGLWGEKTNKRQGERSITSVRVYRNDADHAALGGARKGFRRRSRKGAHEEAAYATTFSS